MAAAVLDDSLETWLNKATNVLSKEDDWEAIVGFCDKVNKDLEGPQTAVRLLVHKIQSPQERESLLALTTIEACAKNCGRRFQQEIGKFRFINEMIKVVSPKYLGSQMSERVKQKVIELLYGWSQVLTHEPKIKEAYQMLRRQGIVRYDPVHIDRTLEPPSPPPPRNSIFEDEDKSKLLSRLLRSKNPDDLQAANRLIKNLVKQDAERMEKVSKRVRQLETILNNVKLLNDMLHNHQPGNATQSDKEIMKELKNTLEKERPNLFQLASLTDERDNAGFGEIMKANDEVIKVMSLYDEVVNKADVNNLLIDDKHSFMADLESLSVTSPVSVTSPQYTSLLDEHSIESTNGFVHQNNSTTDDFGEFFGVSSAASPSHSVTLMTPANSSSVIVSTSDSSQLPLTTTVLLPLSTADESSNELSVLDLTFEPPVIGHTSASVFTSPLVPLLAPSVSSPPSTLLSTSTLTTLGSPPSSLLPMSVPPLISPSTATQHCDLLLTDPQQSTSSPGDMKSLSSLEQLGKSLLEQSLSTVKTTAEWKPHQPPVPAAKIPLNQLAKMSQSANTSLTPSVQISATSSSVSAVELQPLTDVFVELSTIQPGSLCPLVAYDKNGLKVMFHFGKDRPRSDVQVVAVSVMSTNASPIKNFTFQAAVPKSMKVKLQPASATDLPAYNPILPPAAITQVMLIAYPAQEEKIRLKYKMSYTINSSDVANVSDVGDLQFSLSAY
jgi:ADP-ribosylation factor-binding protein GGA